MTLESPVWRRAVALLLVATVAAPAGAAPPVARPDVFINPGGVPIVVDVLANDSAPDGHPLHVHRVGVPAPHGTAAAQADGTILFQSSPGVVAPAQFTYWVRVERGRESSALVDVTPIYLYPRGATGFAAAALGPGHIQLRWHDAQGETHYLVRGGTSSSAPDDPGAQLAQLAAGVEVFDHLIAPAPPPGTRFYYRLLTCNAEGCDQSVVVSAQTPAAPANQLPTAGTDTVPVLSGESMPIPFTRLLENDSDPEDAALTIAPLVGPVTLAKGTLYPMPDGFRYVQSPAVLNPPQTDSFTYLLSDGTHEVQGTVVIQIQANRPVSANDDHWSAVGGLVTQEGRALFIPWSTLVANDTGAPIRPLPLWCTRPEHGRIDFASQPNVLTAAPEGLWYLPADGFQGEDRFSYSAFNHLGTDTALVTVRVDALAGEPDATTAPSLSIGHMLVADRVQTGKAFTVVPFSDLLHGFSGTAVTASGDALQLQLQTNYLGGIVTLPGSGWKTPGLTSPSSAFAPVGYEGALVFESAASPGSPTNGSHRFTLKGAAGNANGTVTLRTIQPSEVAMRAVNNQLTAISGERIQIGWRDLAEDDFCGGAPPQRCSLDDPRYQIDFAHVSRPQRGSLSHLESWGGFYYYAPVNYSGVDHFTYALYDQQTDTRSIGRVVVMISSGAPVAGDDGPVTVLADQPQTIVVTGNDSDPNGGALTVTAVSSPAHGFALVSGPDRVTYSPAPGHVGGDSFVYTLRDAQGNTDTATVTVNVVPVVAAIVIRHGATALANGGSHAFGQTTTGLPVTATFTVENPGYLPLQIGQVLVPYGFTVPVPPPASIPVGGSGSFTVKFDPALGGLHAGALELETNDPDDNPFRLQLSGLGIEDEIFEHDFENALAPDLFGWSSIQATSPATVLACAQAAMFGPSGLCVNVVPQAGAYVADFTPKGEKRYRARFYFDPSALAMADGSLHYLFTGRTDAATNAFEVRLQKAAGAFQIRGTGYRNDTTNLSTPWVPVSGRTLVEVDWKGADPGQANGYLKLWTNEVATTDAANLANDQVLVEEVRLGAYGGIDAGTSGPHLYDAFESRRLSYIGPEKDLFADGFEPDLARWSSSSGAVSACSEAAYNGLAGLCVEAGGVGTAGSVTDETPAAESHYRARFRFDPSDLAMAGGNLHYLLNGLTGSGASVFDVRLRASGGALQLRAAAYQNDGSTFATPWTALVGPSLVELEWRAAGGGPANGTLRLWLDGQPIGELLTVSSSALRLEAVKLGAFGGIDAGTTGTHRFDNFASWR